MHTALAVHMAMTEFIARRVADRHNLDGKRQCFAGQGVVHIAVYIKATHLHDRDLLTTLVGFNRRGHARQPLPCALQMFNWNTLECIGLNFAISL